MSQSLGPPDDDFAAHLGLMVPISTQPEPEEQLFCCPFEPQFHIQSASSGVPLNGLTECSTIRLSSIRRLRKHIFKYHLYNDEWCLHCMQTFSSSSSLEQHKKDVPDCDSQARKPVRAVMPTKVVLPEQEKAFRATVHIIDRTEHWNAIFRALFPGTPLPTSPYWDIIREETTSLRPPSDESTIIETRESISLLGASRASSTVQEPLEATLMWSEVKPQQLASFELDLPGIAMEGPAYAKERKRANLSTKSFSDSGYGTQEVFSTVPEDNSHASKMVTKLSSSKSEAEHSLRSVNPNSPTGSSHKSNDHAMPFIAEEDKDSRAHGRLDLQSPSDVEHFLTDLVVKHPVKKDIVYRLLNIGSNDDPHEPHFEHLARVDEAQFLIWCPESHQLGNFWDLEIINIGHQEYRGFASKSLPSTFRDAIHMTRNLGYRYLWVDVLCTIEDDFGNHQHQYAGTDLIYQKAGGKITVNPLPKTCDYLEPVKDQSLTRFSQYHSQSFCCTEGESFALSRWLRTPARDDPWNVFRIVDLSLNCSNARLPVYYFPPSKSSRWTTTSTSLLTSDNVLTELPPHDSSKILLTVGIREVQVTL